MENPSTRPAAKSHALMDVSASEDTAGYNSLQNAHLPQQGAGLQCIVAQIRQKHCRINTSLRKIR
jgi:hypothetical protein